MSIIKSLNRLVWGQLQTHCFILELPVEILVKILAFLPLYSQLLVHQTCRPLRAITHEYFLAGKGNIMASITPEDKLLYLTHLARSLPDRWVCAKCCKLHQINEWDTPLYLSSSYSGCIDGSDSAERYKISRIFGYPKFYPGHRHVELTLKYTRMQDKKRRHQKYFQRLLTPYHGQMRGYFNVSGGISAQMSAFPKVVNGRYLLLTILDYLEVETKVSRQSIRFIEICSHISDDETSYIHYGMPKNIDEAFETASSAENTRQFFSCGSCGTDYSIQVSTRRVIICIWEDFGPEGTIYDPNWRAIACDDRVVYHQSGSIRELYGPLEHNGEIY